MHLSLLYWLLPAEYLNNVGFPSFRENAENAYLSLNNKFVDVVHNVCGKDRDTK